MNIIFILKITYVGYLVELMKPKSISSLGSIQENMFLLEEKSNVRNLGVTPQK